MGSEYTDTFFLLFLQTLPVVIQGDVLSRLFLLFLQTLSVVILGRVLRYLLLLFLQTLSAVILVLGVSRFRVL